MKKEIIIAWVRFNLYLSRDHSLLRTQRKYKKAACIQGLGVFLLIQLLVSCSGTGKTVHTMPPEDKQFLSEVRYLISKKEIKIFKSTPPEERRKFIEEFWKERDPDPATEENEFRDEYYHRIERANHLFREGNQGWLSDRGRIYILLGEPERRDVYPSGYSFYDPPVEIWFYANFPVIFIDYHSEGIYKLDTSSARKLGMINITQMRLKPNGIERKVRFFDFTLAIQNLAPGEAKLLMSVPYRIINLIQNEKTGTYETRIKSTIIVTNKSGKKVLEKEEMHSISVNKNQLDQLGKNYTIAFTFKLPAAMYTALVILENTADKSQVKKEIKFKLKDLVP